VCAALGGTTTCYALTVEESGEAEGAGRLWWRGCG
jgi:hypothetical protein